MPCLVPIDAPDDLRIADYRDVKERDLVGRQGRFIAEGAVVLRLLLASSRHRPLSLLIAAHRVETLSDLLAEVPDNVPVYTAAQPVLDAIAGFPLHRGILALGERIDPPGPDELLAGLPERALVLVLCGIGNHDNMGGILRNAAGFAADAVLIDSGCCDPLYRKAIRVSVGAALTVPWSRMPAGTDPVVLLERHGFQALSLSPSGATVLASLRRRPRAAMLLGSEGPGLPAAVLARTNAVAIPMAPGFDSLNVATTSGIVLHHLAFMAGDGTEP